MKEAKPLFPNIHRHRIFFKKKPKRSDENEHPETKDHLQLMRGRGTGQRKVGRQAEHTNLKETSSRNFPSDAKHTNTKNLGLQPRTVPRRLEQGTRNPAIECSNGHQMRKSLNPFGEGECGMLLSAWEGTGRRTRKEQGAPEDKQGSRGYVLKRCTGTTVRKRQKSEQKRRKTEYESKK
jgi:hypothetical protein